MHVSNIIWYIKADAERMYRLRNPWVHYVTPSGIANFFQNLVVLLNLNQQQQQQSLNPKYFGVTMDTQQDL